MYDSVESRFFMANGARKSVKNHRKVSDDRADIVVSVRMKPGEARLLDALRQLDEDHMMDRSGYIRELIQAESKRRKKDLKTAGYEVGIVGQMSIMDYLG